MADTQIADLLKTEPASIVSDNQGSEDNLSISPEHLVSRMYSIKQMYDFFNFCNNKSYLNKRVGKNEIQIADI